ncbi:GNAT family N-acetyltransferase [Myroides injenensis]|uniref:GNAT family N-acetyltransferase n=1 Tax=Myroides injenensis TaxID=1183151 RepID=UPI000289F28B|nr:GNAT family N-acetyltransferase [Myroides injenensis]
MNIRKATVEDMPRVLELIRELAEYENEPNAVDITVDDLIRDGFSATPLFNVLLAEHNNETVGMALYYNRYSTWKGKTIHLEDLIVSKNSRGTGAGMALYKEIMKIAKEQNVKRVEWVVLNWNEPAIDFYNKTGATVLKDWYTVQIDEKGINNLSD